MAQAILSQRHFLSGEEFVDELRPTAPRWQPNPSRWIFRGQPQADWPLLPTAFRDKAWAPFGKHRPSKPEAFSLLTWEIEILRRFGLALDRAGLPIPGASLADLERMPIRTKDYRQLIPQYLELIALAQHHGLPTRLLDFTRYGLIAAYFAALAKPRRREPAGRICVWAIDGRLSDCICGVDPWTWLSLHTATRASNHRLRAQHGMFVLWGIPATASPSEYPLDRVVERTVLGSPPAFMRQQGLDVPVMHRLTLPVVEATKVLGLLVHERITGATMFPDVSGVIEGMKEWNRHQQGEHDFFFRRSFDASSSSGTSSGNKDV